jgi:antitoxin HicB
MMTSYFYDAVLDTNGEYLISFPAVAEATTAVSDLSAVGTVGVDALKTAFAIYRDSRRFIFEGGNFTSPRSVALPVIIDLKVYLVNEMLRQGIIKAELARRLHIKSMPLVDRLVDFYHNSRVEQLEQALNILGKKITLLVK